MDVINVSINVGMDVENAHYWFVEIINEGRHDLIHQLYFCQFWIEER